MACSKRYVSHHNYYLICYSVAAKCPDKGLSCFYLGFRKKIEALSKERDCELVREWRKSILNHMYWCVASTTNGDGELMKAKWISVENHVHNVHENHGDLFPMCAHAPLDGAERKKKWFKRRKLYYNTVTVLLLLSCILLWLLS